MIFVNMNYFLKTAELLLKLHDKQNLGHKIIYKTIGNHKLHLRYTMYFAKNIFEMKTLI